jgi:hypothetical protein
MMVKTNSILITTILIILLTVSVVSATDSSVPVMKLYAQTNTFSTNDTISCVFSAINPTTNTDIMHCQTIISAPNGMRVIAPSGVDSDSGQFTMSFDLKPGQLSKANVSFATKNTGDYEITGVSYYYFGNDVSNGGTIGFNTTVHAVDPTPERPPTPGFTSVVAILAMIGCVLYKRKK